MPRPHRYVTEEPHIPFELDVLYEDERIIVVDKPHFLATMPRGMWYRQTALIRLRERLGEPDITPAHRLDRMTAGVLVFVRDKASRGAYQMLFQNKQAAKVYECLAPCRPIARPRYGTIEPIAPPRPFPLVRRSHITKLRGTMAAFEEPGTVNAETLIERGERFMPVAPVRLPSRALYGVRASACRFETTPVRQDHSGLPGDAGDADIAGLAGISRIDGISRLVGASRVAGLEDGIHADAAGSMICRYTLHPRTGKTHQLRVHMNSLGLPIVGDDFYPRIETRAYDDFSRPLQLVARRLAFIDPITHEPREFISRVVLQAA